MLSEKNYDSMDRFIPSRGSQNFEVSNYVLKEETQGKFVENVSPFDFADNSRYVNLAYREYKRQEFENLLWSTLFDKPKKVLNLSVAKKNTKDIREAKNNIWPVKPRKRFQIKSTLIILEVPGITNNLTHNLLDWCDSGNLVSIHDGLVYLYTSKNGSLVTTISFDNDVENCIKWNKKGTAFAASTVNGGLLVFNISLEDVYETTCCPRCRIHYIEWSQDDSHIFTGCGKGYFNVWSAKLKRKMTFRSNMYILKIGVSANNSYIVTTYLGGHLRVWNWPSMDFYEIVIEVTAKAIAFHPWKDSLIAIGTTNGKVYIFNLNTKTLVACSSTENFSCDALAWNKITGELVVSYYMDNCEVNTKFNTIVVFSDLNTITDKITWHSCRVPYLLWGNGGTQLATADTSGDLCIWNFISLERSNKRKSNSSQLEESFSKIR